MPVEVEPEPPVGPQNRHDLEQLGMGCGARGGGGRRRGLIGVGMPLMAGGRDKAGHRQQDDHQQTTNQHARILHCAKNLAARGVVGVART